MKTIYVLGTYIFHVGIVNTFTNIKSNLNIFWITFLVLVINMPLLALVTTVFPRIAFKIDCCKYIKVVIV